LEDAVRIGDLIGLLNAWIVSSIESNSCAISEEGMSECMAGLVRKKKPCAAYAGLKGMVESPVFGLANNSTCKEIFLNKQLLYSEERGEIIESERGEAKPRSRSCSFY